MRVHAVDVRIVNDAVEMEHQGAQGSVVGVGQAVDNGVERVSSNNLVFVFCKYMVSKQVKTGKKSLGFWEMTHSPR